MPRDSGVTSKQHDVLDVAAEHAGLNGRADGHALIRVDALVGLLAGDALHGFLHGGNTGGAAHEDDLVDVLGGDAGVLHGLIERADGLVDQIRGQFVELGAGDGDVQMLGAGGVRGDERQVDVDAHQAGQFDLGLLSGFLQALQGHAVLAQVDAVFLLELGSDVVDQAVVEIVAAQMGVAAGGQHFKHAVADLHEADIERAAAQVVNEDLVGVALVEAVGQRRGGRLVDDALDLEAGDAARVLGGLTLGIGEVRRHGDDGLVDLLAEVAFGVRLELLQDHGRDLRRSVGLAVDVDFIVGAHLALDGDDGAIRIGDGLALGDLADEALAVLGKGHDRRRGAGALRVGDDGRLAALHDGDAGIGGAKVDTDNLAHNKSLLNGCENAWVVVFFIPQRRL